MASSLARSESSKRKFEEEDSKSSKKIKESSLIQKVVSSVKGFVDNIFSPSKPQPRPVRTIKNNKKRNSKPRISMSKPAANTKPKPQPYSSNNNIKKQELDQQKNEQQPLSPLTAYDNLDFFARSSFQPSSPPPNNSFQSSVFSSSSSSPPPPSYSSSSTSYSTSSTYSIPKFSQNKDAYPPVEKHNNFLEEIEARQSSHLFEKKLMNLVLDDAKNSRIAAAPPPLSLPPQSSFYNNNNSHLYSSLSSVAPPFSPSIATPSTPSTTASITPSRSVYNKDKRRSLDVNLINVDDLMNTSVAHIPRALRATPQKLSVRELRRQKSVDDLKLYENSVDYEYLTNTAAKSRALLEQRKQEYLKKHEETLKELAASKDKKVEEVPTITEEQIKKVAEILSMHGDDEDVISEGFNVELKREDIRCLKPCEWLNDEVINFYINLLMERNKKLNKIKSYIFNTHFYSLLFYNTKKYDYARVRRWTSKIGEDVFKLDKVIVPIHLGMHWCLAVINLKQKRFEYYDSLLGSNDECLGVLRRWLQDEAKKSNTALDLTSWTNYTPKEIPTQKNGYDCGVFMLRFADRTSQNSPFSFSQDSMPVVRKLMVLEILNKKAN